MDPGGSGFQPRKLWCKLCTSWTQSRYPWACSVLDCHITTSRRPEITQYECMMMLRSLEKTVMFFLIFLFVAGLLGRIDLQLVWDIISSMCWTAAVHYLTQRGNIPSLLPLMFLQLNTPAVKSLSKFRCKVKLPQLFVIDIPSCFIICGGLQSIICVSRGFTYVPPKLIFRSWHRIECQGDSDLKELFGGWGWNYHLHTGIAIWRPYSVNVLCLGPPYVNRYSHVWINGFTLRDHLT